MVLGMLLCAGGLLAGGFDIGTLFTVPVLGGGVGAEPGSHGGAATVAEVPAGRDVPALVVPTVPLVSGVVLEGMPDAEVVGAVLCDVELAELPVVVVLLEAVVVLLEGVHGATVFVV
jgi:hypothetical protein